MLLSNYYLPQTKEDPTEAEIISHKFMLRSGMVKQAGSGIYNWLPNGFRVLQKITNIVREEQNRAGCVEMLMPTIQQASLWKESGRYDDYGKEMLRIKDRKDREMLYGPTNEEQITDIIKNNLNSYKQFPKLLYHIQWKFRDEIRPRFGVMRGREFLMKDSYSFDVDFASAKISYLKMYVAYLQTFKRLGLVAIPMKASSGPIGGDLSHEFIILANTGESEIYLEKDLLDLSCENVTKDDYLNDKKLNDIFEKYNQYYAATDEEHDAELFAKIPKEKQICTRGIEVGHIFYFGSKYSKTLNASFQDAHGKQSFIEMGSYGIGVSRLVGAIIEASHDENGPIWPISVAPFTLGIVMIKNDDNDSQNLLAKVINYAENNNIDFLIDDLDSRAGEKFSRMDLMGIPYRIIIGPKNAKNSEAELSYRFDKDKKHVENIETIFNIMNENLQK